MGLFSKRSDSILSSEDLADPLPSVQTVQHPPSASQVPPGRARDVRDVRVTGVDPNAPPQATIKHHHADPAQPSTAPHPAPQPASMPPMPSSARFGIEDALRLLRELPGRDMAAVREAVQKTLEFMHVDLERLVEEAGNKDQNLETRASGLQREVEQHEALALAAKKQIAAIQMERTELEAAKTWMIEHRHKENPIPLERVVRGSPLLPDR